MAVPRVRPALLLAILITASATLILGIVPGRTLAAARAGAATYPVNGSELNKGAITHRIDW